MLQAILSNKARKTSDSDMESIRWGDAFKEYEDLLTAAVFGRFSYLSSKVQDHLLKSWLDPKEDFSKLESITFWPRYTLNKEDKDSSVEPDLVLDFPKFSLVVEVKKKKHNVQTLEQWRSQINAFIQSNNQGYKSVYFLAIGGMTKNNEHFPREIALELEHKLLGVKSINWQPLTNSLISLRDLKIVNSQDSYIIADIINALKFHGLKASYFKWEPLIQAHPFANLNLNHPTLENMPYKFDN